MSQGTNVPGNQSPMELISGGTNCLDSIGLAPDLLDWHWLSMDWHWICNELTPRWWGLAAHWLLIYISLTINMVLTLDWYQIGTRFASDWQWIDNDWCSNGIGLTFNWWDWRGLLSLDWQWIRIILLVHWPPSDTGGLAVWSISYMWVACGMFFSHDVGCMWDF